MLPTQSLAGVSDQLTAKASAEAKDLESEKNRVSRLEGRVEVSNTQGGVDTTKLKNFLQGAAKYGAMGAAAYATINSAQTLVKGGKDPFTPGTVGGGTTPDAATLDTALSEIQSDLPAPTPFTGEDAEITRLELESSVLAVAEKEAALATTIQSLDSVNSVIEKRATGELPEPELNVAELSDALDIVLQDMLNSGVFTEEQYQEFKSALEETTNLDISNYEKYVQDRIVTPFARNRAALDIIKAQILGQEEVQEDEAIFDTVYGPPISESGRFILSEDGIYYDSRTGSIPYITAHKIDSRAWELQYAANRGGRGQEYESANTFRYADTIFSDDFDDETGSVLAFYANDDILQNLVNDRELQVQDISGKIADLITEGYATSSAVVKNYEESYAAVAYTYDRKIKKRKKQLQVAALFGPFGITTDGDNSPFGPGQFYKIVSENNITLPDSLCGEEQKVFNLDFTDASAVSAIELIPRIPVNDFSYLKTINLIPSVEAQSSITLNSEDMDDTTAPIVPIFLTKPANDVFQAIPELAIGPYGEADWITTSGDTDTSTIVSSTVSGVVPYLRTLTDSITTDGLVACYNFLEPSAAVEPSSTTFGVRNYADTGTRLNAKLVGTASSIFVSGVTVPYLGGTLYKPGTKYGPRYAYLPEGSYVRLPNNYREDKPYPGSQPIDDLLYNPGGWTMEFWAHVPDLSSGLTGDHRYRLVAANENCGDPTSTLNGQVGTFGNQGNTLTFGLGGVQTKGMIIGWRDRGDPGVAASGLEFVALQTVAQNDPVWGQSVVISEEISGQGADPDCREEVGFKIDLTSSSESGYSIGEASSTFAHHALVFDYNKNAVSLYLNGEFLASSVYSDSFKVTAGSPLSLPTKIGGNHFHAKSVNEYFESLYSTPIMPAAPVFTPWVLGGGFTDGISDSPFTTSLNTTFPGFLGTNTNTSYYKVGSDTSGGPYGQHTNGTVPGLGGYTKNGIDYDIARSSLEGYLGSFKLYSKPLTTEEVEKNYNAQSPFFGGIQVPKRLL